MNKLIAHNYTIEIAYILLKVSSNLHGAFIANYFHFQHMRNSFENSIAAGQIPQTMEMLRQFMHLLDKLAVIKCEPLYPYLLFCQTIVINGDFLASSITQAIR